MSPELVQGFLCAVALTAVVTLVVVAFGVVKLIRHGSWLR